MKNGFVCKQTTTMSAKLNWKNLEKPLSKVVLEVIKDDLHFEKMTPVQVC